MGRSAEALTAGPGEGYWVRVESRRPAGERYLLRQKDCIRKVQETLPGGLNRDSEMPGSVARAGERLDARHDFFIARDCPNLR